MIFSDSAFLHIFSYTNSSIFVTVVDITKISTDLESKDSQEKNIKLHLSNLNSAVHLFLKIKIPINKNIAKTVRDTKI